jgi:hypothetical protein
MLLKEFCLVGLLVASLASLAYADFASRQFVLSTWRSATSTKNFDSAIKILSDEVVVHVHGISGQVWAQPDGGRFLGQAGYRKWMGIFSKRM